ncbi:MAG: hypothetical protein RSE54_11600, partial [Ruthenibacterium sp.]
LLYAVECKDHYHSYPEGNRDIQYIFSKGLLSHFKHVIINFVGTKPTLQQKLCRFFTIFPARNLQSCRLLNLPYAQIKQPIFYF